MEIIICVLTIKREVYHKLQASKSLISCADYESKLKPGNTADVYLVPVAVNVARRTSAN